MRFGLWAAAAAALLCAGQASAATFVLYEAQGSGFQTTQDATTTVKTGDFYFDFIIETDAGYSNGASYGTGSTYRADMGPSNFSMASISGGTLSINGRHYFASAYGPSYSATIVIPQITAYSFNDIPASSVAAGLVSYGYATSNGGTLLSGSVLRLIRLGTVSGFSDPTVTFLPEPATWMMMILGVGGIGASLRRWNERSSNTRLA